MGMKARILVVDDDEQLLKLLDQVLSGLGVEVCAVESGQRAAELVGKDKFDGVFLDWKMPKMTGMELARRVRDSEPNSDCPIVMLTGHPSPSAVEESRDAGVDFFLPKPLSMHQIGGVLDAMEGMKMGRRPRARRVPMRSRVIVRWGLNRIEGQTRNVSSSGMLAVFESSPPIGSRVTLEFTLPGDDTPIDLGAQVSRVTICAHVARVTPNRQVGFRFTDSSSETTSRLGHYLSSIPDTVAP